MRRIITLTTDFGTADTFVGVMMGVILSVAPDVVIVDLTHEIPVQDVMVGALALESAVDYFPRGTIHVAVVDPGVGTQRLPLALSTERATYIGPDNGLFTLALRRTPLRQAVRLSNPATFRHPVSATFHGRDVFASATAHLAAGFPFQSLGDSVDSIVELAVPEPIETEDGLRLQILAADRFGNLVTNLERSQWDELCLDAPKVRIRAGTTETDGIGRTYADVVPGEAIAYFGSGGRLEIGIRNGSAREATGCRVGDDILVRRDD